MSAPGAPEILDPTMDPTHALDGPVDLSRFNRNPMRADDQALNVRLYTKGCPDPTGIRRTLRAS